MTRGAAHLAGDRPGASATPSKRALWWAELSEAERQEHDALLATELANVHAELNSSRVQLHIARNQRDDAWRGEDQAYEALRSAKLTIERLRRPWWLRWMG